MRNSLILSLKFFLKAVPCLVATAVVFKSGLLVAQDSTWDGGTAGTGTAWLTLTNWAGDTNYAGSIGNLANANIATVTAGTGTTLGINMSTASGNFSLGAIDFSRATAATLNNSSSTVPGILRLNGATVGGQANTLIRLAGASNLTVAASSTGTLGLQLGNANGIFNVSSGRTLTISSNITELNAGSGFTKTGDSTLFLSGTNTYTGNTTINGGIVRFDRIASMPSSGNVAVNTGTSLHIDVGGAGEWTNGTSGIGTVGGLLAGVGGAGAGTVSYTGNVTLGLNNGTDFSYSGNINNVGTSLALTKDGAGILTLTGNNLFSGVFSMNAGSVRVGSSSSLGTNGTINASTSTTNVFAATGSAAISLSKSFSTNLGGGGITFGDATGTGDLTFTGNLARASGATNRTTNVSGSTVVTFNGNLISPGSGAATTFFKGGTGTLRILGTGNAGDVGFSTVAVTGGNLEVTRLANIGSASSLGTATNAIAGAVSIILDGGSLNYVNGGTAASSTNRLLQIGRTTAGGTGTIRNNATSALETVTFSNTNAIAFGTVDQTRSLVLGGTNTGSNTLSSQINNNGVAVVSLTKQDAGKWVLTAANGYTGNTTVSDGTLIVNGSTASGSSVTVNSTGVLGGTGTVAGAITVASGGTLAPGASIESLATGAVTLNGGSVFAYEMDNDAAPTSAGDLLAVTGNLTLSTNIADQTDISFSELGAGTWTAGEKLTLISYSGTWSGGLFDYLGNSVADDSLVSINGLNWTFNYNDGTAGANFVGDLTGASFVTITAIPEPTALLMVGLAVAGCVIRRRR